MGSGIMSRKGHYFGIFALLFLAVNVIADDTSPTTDAGKKPETSFRVVPTISSNPTSGTGLGLMSSLIYSVDEKSSPSQFMVLADYTDTDSWAAIAMNTLYAKHNNFKSITVGGYIFNRSSFTGADVPNDGSADFNVTMDFIFEQVLFRVDKSLFAGATLIYLDANFEPTNTAGETFLVTTGTQDSASAGLGGIVEYDTRKNKYSPAHGEFITGTLNAFKEVSGGSDDYFNSAINARWYRPGFKLGDVLAMQIDIKTSSSDTPGAMLPSLGSRNVLRGFSIGQYKSRTLSAAQFEYRYKIGSSRFLATGFAGIAELSGGSQGTDEGGNRDKDVGTYYSGGFGMQFLLQPKVGVVYRVDVAVNNFEEYSLYAAINQPF